MQNTPAAATDVVREIKQMLADDLQLRVVPEDIPDDYSLLERGLALDSILIAELIVQIENRFGLQFDDRVLDTRLFDKLSALADFVARECLAKSNDGPVGLGGSPC